jgi:SAM-dependent methyltransferase
VNDKVSQSLTERRIQERLFPKPGDRDYLHLADLLLAMKDVATAESLTLLDYGAGSSPYRSLFPHSQYRRADISSKLSVESVQDEAVRDESYPEPDCIILPDGRVPHESNTVDLILSTQVLEHVRDPKTYLSECFRLLKPAGRLFLTTHGSWHDHDDPNDFWRWTADGLKYDLEKIGFTVLSVKKLTTGPRAVLWFMQRHLLTHSLSRKTFFGLCHWLCRLVPSPWIHKQADRLYPHCRVVSADVPDHKIYLAVAVHAERPLTSNLTSEGA